MKLFNKLRRIDIPLILIGLLSAFFNGYNIWNEHYVNTYYTTTVASMMQSFHNFFYASLDSAGFVTVDKPPVTFWIQTLSAEIFGLHGWSVILPQALSGIGSVLLIYLLVKPTFGLSAARIGALVMACSPVAVSVSRTNNIDAMLVFTLLLATWLLFKGVKNNRWGYLIGAFAMIGVAFNMKMMQAYMVVPAFLVFIVIAWKVNKKKKISVMAAAIVVMLLLSLSWAVIVDSIPKDQRPYIGSSDTDSVLELAFGYNGISRLTGEQGGGGGFPNGMGNGGGIPSGGFMGDMPTGDAGDRGQAQGDDGRLAPGGRENITGVVPENRAGNPGFADGGGMGGSSGRFGTGVVGPLRLFQAEMSDQSSWLLPFVAFALIGLFASIRRRNFTMKHKETLFWLAWLIPAMGFFSIAEFFHTYYLIMLAPPIAALVGTGWSELWKQYRSGVDWTSWLLPAAIPMTAAFEYYILRPFNATIGSGWAKGTLVGGILIGLLLVLLKRRGRSFTPSVALIGLLILLIGPFYWSATPIVYGQNSMLPEAGPGSNSFGGMGGNGNDGGGMNGTQIINKAALSYLESHNTGETYLFATSDYSIAAPYIIEAGAKVIITGGFTGSDPALTVAELAGLVGEGELKYFITSASGGGRGGNSELSAWITKHGTVIPTEEWSAGSNTDQVSFQGGSGGSMILYQLKAEAIIGAS